ncbi:hypothetical protein AMC83_PA00047 (plasmid) [Rhizobium phaseoli]|uniref:hypothetical protein n=1 Tax=Rhizobium phaseoli TaxID=396 RepID=UPI0007EA305A|nr:hypothetical protein [Rhizobium phaseoli]ANL74274.1 hypothetical protein AMC83_PA00047 [Rhizobium phaseoli]
MTTFDEIKSSFPSLFPASARVDCGDGWAGIVGKLLDGIATTVGLPEMSQFRILSVRQDLGFMKIDAGYGGIYDDVFRPMLMLAEFRSRVTCEECGRPGHMRTTNGWKRCRCDEHSTPEEREQPPRPAWTLGRETTKGFVWYDQAADELRIVDDLASIGMPAHHIERRKDGL